MSALLHLSDTHFGTERAEVVEALVRLAAEQKPDVAVLSGDITQRARRSQFAAARRLMDRLTAAVKLAIPGNHDIPLFDLLARWRAPYANFERAFGAELEPIHESPDFLVICVNTACPRRHVQGQVSRRQIERVAQRLRAAAAEQLRIVVAHHPVHVTHREDEKNLLRGHDRALDEWARAGADLVLGGHIHLPYVACARERLPHRIRPLWAVQAGTAVSWRVREQGANSVNFVRYHRTARPAACVAERWDYNATQDRFVLTESIRIPIDRVEAE